LHFIAYSIIPFCLNLLKGYTLPTYPLHLIKINETNSFRFTATAGTKLVRIYIWVFSHYLIHFFLFSWSNLSALVQYFSLLPINLCGPFFNATVGFPKDHRHGGLFSHRLPNPIIGTSYIFYSIRVVFLYILTCTPPRFYYLGSTSMC